MPDSSKLEKLNRELEKSEKKLRKAINDEKALQHQLKQLTRKERTHRLCTRGGMLESFLQEPERLTDDDIMLLFSHSYFRLAVSAHGMSASELLSSRLMFPTPLASDNNTARDAASLDVFLSDNGIFRKRNRNGAIWRLSLSAAVFYLTPVASDGFRSTLKPSAFDPAKKDGNLSAQIISQERPVSETAALNPDWVEWLMGFPKGWTDVSSGPPSQKESPA